MQTLYSGIPETINTNERIFKIVTFDNETVLCNTSTAKMLLANDLIKSLYHLWNFKFERFSKADLKTM